MSAYSLILDDGREGAVAWVPSKLKFYELDYAHAGLAREVLRRGSDLPHAYQLAETMLGDEGQTVVGNLASAGFFDEPEGIPVKLEHRIEPSGFRVSVTEKCNLRCRGCFSTTYLSRYNQPLRTMSLSTADAVCDHIIIPWLQKKALVIHFFGGEPLLRLPILRRIAERITSQPRNRFACTFMVTTNGTALSHEHLDFIRRFEVRVGISVELDQQIHDSIRVSPSGKGSFLAARETFHRLRDAGVDVHILTTPYPPLPPDAIDKWTRLLDEFPAHSITINTPFDDVSLAWLETEEHLTFLLDAHRVAAGRGVEIDSALTPIIAAIADGIPRLTPQAAVGSDVLVGIDPDGNIVRSTQKFSSELASGMEGEFGKYTFASECADCDARFVCGGPNEEYQLATGRILDPEKCGFHLGALRAIALNRDVFAER